VVSLGDEDLQGWLAVGPAQAEHFRKPYLGADLLAVATPAATRVRRQQCPGYRPETDGKKNSITVKLEAYAGLVASDVQGETRSRSRRCRMRP
jgi:hypothetical protein